MAAYTAINDLFDQAPAKRVLMGDKKRKAEPAQHIIEFPGGAIELSRLDDGSYWAHIIVNQRQKPTGSKGFNAAYGAVINSRIDWHGRRIDDIPGLPDQAALTQIAIHIQPSNEPKAPALCSNQDGTGGAA